VKTIPIPQAGGTIDVKLIPRDRRGRANSAGMSDDKLYFIDTRPTGDTGLRLLDQRPGRLAATDPYDALGCRASSGVVRASPGDRHPRERWSRWSRNRATTPRRRPARHHDQPAGIYLPRGLDPALICSSYSSCSIHAGFPGSSSPKARSASPSRYVTAASM